MLSSSIDGHACIINCDRLLSCGLFVMPCHGKFHCTSFNDGNPMINGKNALVTVTVDLGCSEEHAVTVFRYYSEGGA